MHLFGFILFCIGIVLFSMSRTQNRYRRQRKTDYIANIMSYATEVEVAYAKNLKYLVTKNSRIGHQFQKGIRYVWRTRDGWQTTDLINDTFVNHQIFDHLNDALNAPPRAMKINT